MRLKFLIPLFCLIMAIQSSASFAWAFERETRVPLVGSNQYFAASGSARLYEIRRVNKQKDREELVVDVKNVPLKPGSVLVVSVDEEQIGKIVLSAKRSGSLKLTSEFRRTIPSVTAGTSVTITTLEGRLVMR